MPEKRVALVTGASAGIGRATALEFAANGYDIGVTALEDQALNGVADQLRAKGARVLARPGDLADLRFAQSFVQGAATELGAPHVLVNNAAWRELVTMREISADSWERTLRVCVTAPAFMARWVAEQMEPLHRGAIINVSSIMSGHANGLAPAYVASKGAIDSLTYDLAALYGPSGIRVLSVRPGAVDTAMSADIAPKESKESADLRQWSEQMISLRRWAQPQEIARAIVWLAGDEASYITGTSIVLDGGWSRQLYPYGLKNTLRPTQFPDR
jgi:NAD(P)-dependent dehydrogenase (short-subunit alcohol dehydrogenase family)